MEESWSFRVLIHSCRGRTWQGELVLGRERVPFESERELIEALERRSPGPFAGESAILTRESAPEAVENTEA